MDYNQPHDPRASAPLSIGAGIKTLEGKELLRMLTTLRDQVVADGLRISALEERLKATP